MNSSTIQDHIKTDSSNTPGWVQRVDKYIREPCLVVGCGKGTFLDKSDNIFGVDYYWGAAQNASKFGEGRVVQGEASDLPFASGTFESVLMVHSLEHFPCPLEAVNEARRVLCEGGELYIEVPNSSNYVSERRGHLYGWTKRLMSNLLSEAGFNTYSVDYLDLWGSIIPSQYLGENSKIENIFDTIHNQIFPNKFRRLRARAVKEKTASN